MAERKHPDWIKVRAPVSPEYFRTKAILGELKLHSVCQEACCPNIGECFSHRTATFMLMGDVCTRNCPYCAVAHGKVRPLDADEPRRIAEAVARLGLQHVVVTSVDRDDLPDGGAAHFAATAHAIKANPEPARVEVLVPDFQGAFASVETVVESPIDIYNHNIETVPSLYRAVRPGGNYARSLDVIRHAKDVARQIGKPMFTKAGVMLGLGETNAELLDVIRDLRSVECDILTLGQYLRPSAEHIPVARYVPPAEFAEIKTAALAMGFHHVESGPLVRSSYHAWEHVQGVTPAPSIEKIGTAARDSKILTSPCPRRGRREPKVSDGRGATLAVATTLICLLQQARRWCWFLAAASVFFALRLDESAIGALSGVAPLPATPLTRLTPTSPRTRRG